MNGWLLVIVLLIVAWVGGCIGHAIGTGEIAELWDARPRRNGSDQ